ncbi:MAG: hypothetical protein KBT28_10895 [Bacteroidales bacterium]|nr:hypothetical protein [Candidatus Colimorpha merdihippi]
MQYRKLTTALIATLALCTTSCRSSRIITSQNSSHDTSDTLRQTIHLTLHDTIRETTTITIQTNSHGDTTRITTLRDRQSATHRDLAALQAHNTSESHSQNTENASTIRPATLHSIAAPSPIAPLRRSLFIILLPVILSLSFIPIPKLIHLTKNNELSPISC